MLRRNFLAGALTLAAGAAQAQLLRPGTPTGFRPGFRFLSSDDADVVAYIAALTTPPSSAERARLNALVAGLKADGVWPLLDRLNVLAAETSQAGLRDLRNPAKTLTIGGAVTFTADRGFQGDGSTGFLDFGETFNASGNSYAQDGALFGIWCNLQSAVSGVKAQGGNVSATARTSIAARSTAGNETFQINDGTSDVFMASNLSRTGHRVLSRPDAGIKRGFFNGTKVADLTTASVGINATNGALLRSGASYTDDRLCLSYSGGAMADALVSALHARVSTYLSGKGAA